MMGFRPTRIDVKINAVYYLNKREAQGTIINISVTGLGMEVKQVLLVGDLVHISFKLPFENNPEIKLWGIVKKNVNNILGINYEEISDQSISCIKKYIDYKLLKGGIAPNQHFK